MLYEMFLLFFNFIDEVMEFVVDIVGVSFILF